MARKRDLNDPRAVGQAAARERLGKREDLADVGWILSDPKGRRFMWRLLSQGHIFESCFVGNNTTFWNEGKRDLALEFLMDTQRFPELYLQMVRENRPQEEPPETKKEAQET